MFCWVISCELSRVHRSGVNGRFQGGHSNSKPVSSTSSCKLLKVGCLSRWMTRARGENCSAEVSKANRFLMQPEMFSLRPESWLPHAQFSACRKWVMQCNDARYRLIWLLPEVFWHFADEPDTWQTPEERSYSQVVLLVLHNAFIFLPSLPAFMLPAPPVLFPNWTVLKIPLCLPFTTSSWDSIFSLSVCEYMCVCISLCVWLSAEFLWYHSSFRSRLSYDNSQGIIQYCCSRCFDVWKEAFRADMTVRMKHEKERSELNMQWQEI